MDASSGLGIYEYLIWIEKMGMQSIMAVWDGYSLDGTAVPEGDLAPYIEQARAQVSFIYCMIPLFPAPVWMLMSAPRINVD